MFIRRVKFNDEITIKGWQIWAIVLAFAPIATFYICFVHAFLRDGYRFAIAINVFHEAHIELVILTVLLVWITVACGKMLIDWRKKYGKVKEVT